MNSNPALRREQFERELAQSIDLADLGQVMEVRDRARNALEDTLERVIREARGTVADLTGTENPPTLVGW